MSKNVHSKVQDCERSGSGSESGLYSSLFENAPISLWSMDLSRVKRFLNELQQSGVQDIRACLAAEPSLLKECLSRVVINDVNLQTLILFEAQSKDQILSRFADIAGREESALSNMDSMAAIAENKNNYQAYCVHWTLHGKKLDILYNWWVLPGEEVQYRKVLLAVVDITSIREQELALRLKDHAVQSSIHGIVFSDVNDRIAYANPAFLKMWGYAEDDNPVGKSILSYWVEPETADQVLRFVRQTGRGLGELTARRKDGSVFEVQYSACAISDKQGRIISIQMSCMDVSEQKKTERQLVQNEKQYRTLVESMLDAVLILVDEKIVYANPAASKLLDARGGDGLLDHVFTDFLEPEYAVSSMERYQAVCRYGKMQPFKEVRAVRSDGAVIDIESAMLPFVYNDKPAVLAIVRDITEDKAIKKQLLQQQDQLRRLVGQLIRAEELQRRRIASELHDHIGQDLILAKMKIDQMSAGFSVSSTSLQSVSDQLESIVEQVQSLTFDMASPSLFSNGLREALNDWLDNEVQSKYSLSVGFQYDDRADGLAEEIQVFLYRAIKELVINVIKHARACRIEIAAALNNDSITVSVKDDGVGMEWNGKGQMKSKGGGYGLLNLRQRIAYMGGSFEVTSTSGQGTRVSFSIPIELNSGQKQ
jgi:PAS domain S-box-containing protein